MNNVPPIRPSAAHAGTQWENTVPDSNIFLLGYGRFAGWEHIAIVSLESAEFNIGGYPASGPGGSGRGRPSLPRRAGSRL